MTSKYDQIREANIREYGEGTRHLAFLGQLYSDRTHFIFELLQNAEDAGATRIRFHLFPDRLEVTHDGRSFDENDVRGICGVGESTKSEDLTKIGKFGIGFKSVYAYSTAPEIHSGEEHFRIDHYVRPESIEPKEVAKPWTTMFRFPFDQGKVGPDVAAAEIGERLERLSARTLLFLRNIAKIAWQVEGGAGGLYSRETKQSRRCRQVRVIGANPNAGPQDERWLVFERPVQSESAESNVRVEIAFKLGKEDEKDAIRIERIDESPLVVYFPTEKDTRLGFLLQGPYRTTPARDNIPRDDAWNRQLIAETGQLLADTMPYLRDKGLLTVASLQALPVRIDNFPEDGMFRPLFDKIKEAVRTETLIPTADGGFTSASRAIISRGAELRDLLSGTQVAQLFDNTTVDTWLSGEITQDRTPYLRQFLVSALGVPEMTPDSLARSVTEQFLSQQSDEWMTRFYRFLLEHPALWRASNNKLGVDGQIRRRAIVRLESGEHVMPFQDDGSPNVYLPDGESTGFRVIRRSIAEDPDARSFFVQLGIPVPDPVAVVIEQVLPRYTDSGGHAIESEEHRHHIAEIVLSMQTDSASQRNRLMRALENTPFVRCRNASTGNLGFVCPSVPYVRSESLEHYFAGNNSIWFLDEGDDPTVLQALQSIGAAADVRVTAAQPDQRGLVRIESKRGSHVRGLNGFDPRCTVEGLAHALSNVSLETALFIWNAIAAPYGAHIKGIVEKSTRQSYDESDNIEEVSQMGRLLIESSWLPDGGGDWVKPQECSLETLPPEFRREERLAQQLGMRGGELSELAKKAGIAPDLLDIMRELQSNPEILAETQRLVEERKTSLLAEFPTQESQNPERRQAKMRERVQDAESVVYGKKEVRVRLSKSKVAPSDWLSLQYTNQDGQLVCQMCEHEMPFKKRNGEYYFEAVELISGLAAEHEATHGAFCPLCAAKYKEFVKRDPDQMAEVQQALRTGDELRIALTLGDDAGYLRFVGTHRTDLKVVLEQEDSAGDESEVA